MKIFVQAIFASFIFSASTTLAADYVPLFNLMDDNDPAEPSYEDITNQLKIELKEKMSDGTTEYVCAVRNMETINLFPDSAAVTKQVTAEEIKKGDTIFDEGSAILGGSYLFPVEQAFVLKLADIATKTLQGSNMTYWIDGESRSFTATELRNHGPYYDEFKEQSVSSSADIYNLIFDSTLKRGEVLRIRKQHQLRNPRVAEITRLYFECTDYK